MPDCEQHKEKRGQIYLTNKFSKIGNTYLHNLYHGDRTSSDKLLKVGQIDNSIIQFKPLSIW